MFHTLRSAAFVASFAGFASAQNYTMPSAIAPSATAINPAPSVHPVVVSGWKYYGCLSSQASFANFFPAKLNTTHGITVDSCAAACSGSKYAGLAFGYGILSNC
jgi:hypothetical protein